jgi:hypothetical protein
LQSKYYRDLTGCYTSANTSEQFVPRLFYARILLFTAAFGHFLLLHILQKQ